jgi:DNA polymerase-3 subunit epsilon
MTALVDLEVLALDCQATGADPARGHLLEVGWVVAEGPEATARLVKLPPDVEVPERVKRVTGLSEDELARGVDPEGVWRLVAEAAAGVARRNGLPLCPTVVHFASFEERHLRWLHFRAARESAFPFRFFCTHRIASRLLPELPRKSLRAVAGYFGYPLPESRRSGEHARATLAVWRALLARLECAEGVRTLDDLFEWLRAPRRPSIPRRYPMSQGAGRELPSGPGVYRLLRATGDVLYVGKATSLRERVSSYFRPGAPHAEHTLEMLSQARDIGFTETPTALEAALLETDEIKRLEPPYNRALRRGTRRLVFASRGLDRLSDEPDRDHPVGPLLTSDLLAAYARLLELFEGGTGVEAAIALALPERFAPEPESLRTGLDLLRRELSGVAPLAYGARLWPLLEAEEEGAEPDDFQLAPERGARHSPGPEAVAARAKEIFRRVAHLVRRAHWHALLGESSLAWCARDGRRRALVFEGATARERHDLHEPAPPPCPPGHARPGLERRGALDLDAYDRMTVLTRELRRLVAEGREPALRLGPDILIGAPRLQRLLRWV